MSAPFSTGKDFPVSDCHFLLAPYVWKKSASESPAWVEAMMPGAYLKVTVQSTATVELLIDGGANAGCAPAAMPVIEYSIDHGEFRPLQLRIQQGVYALPLADRLDASAPHRVEIVFRSAYLKERWETTKSHLRISGLRLGPEGALGPCPPLNRNAIVFGDSITEGVAVEGKGPYYVDLMLNNARVTWAPIVCAALQCEYGQLGTGGHGIVRPLEIPPLPITWDHYDAATSRLTNGRLVPEPDYVLCLLGTNDREVVKPNEVERVPSITSEYASWLSAVREASPHAVIACITPPLGLHSMEIAAAVKLRNEAGDRDVLLVDTAPLRDEFLRVDVDSAGLIAALKTRPTQLAYDGVHPSEYGNGILAAFVVAEIFKQRYNPPLPLGFFSP